MNPRTHVVFGTYVVVGESFPPAVITLDARQQYMFNARRATTRQVVEYIDEDGTPKYKVGSKSAPAIAATFGAGATYALPAWSREAMELLAAQYEGPHQAAVRALCATIALGPATITFEEMRRGSAPRPTPSGKGSAKLVPKKPIKPAPAGATFRRPTVTELGDPAFQPLPGGAS